jgi:hypothetical protein
VFFAYRYAEEEIMLRGQTGVEGKGGKEESSWVNGAARQREAHACEGPGADKRAGVAILVDARREQ